MKNVAAQRIGGERPSPPRALFAASAVAVAAGGADLPRTTELTAMGIDLGKVAAKAIETALEDGQSQRRSGSTMRALAAGAALAVAARAAVSKGPGLVHLPGPVGAARHP